ncbi:hypothetical protein ACVWYN_001551 [Pedobacter sp. UYP24]
MKITILFAILTLSGLSCMAQQEVSQSVSLGIPKELKKVSSTTYNKKNLQRAKHPFIKVYDGDGSQTFETDGVLMIMHIQKEKIDEFLFQGEESDVRKIAALNYYKFITTEVRKFEGYQVLVKNFEFKDDPIGYIICYGVPKSYNKLLVITIQYEIDNKPKVFKILDQFLKGSRFKN